jgi:hypothetical protein
MLRSSILGREFVNYRKENDNQQRLSFSNKVRTKGLGYIPIIIDSVDKELSEALGERDMFNPRYIKHGMEVIIHMDLKVYDLKEIIIEKLLDKGLNMVYENYNLGLEDGTIIDMEMELGGLYKSNRNKDDKILYILLTREKTMYGYILSILKYLKDNISNAVGVLLKKMT